MKLNLVKINKMEIIKTVKGYFKRADAQIVETRIEETVNQALDIFNHKLYSDLERAKANNMFTERLKKQTEQRKIDAERKYLESEDANDLIKQLNFKK